MTDKRKGFYHGSGRITDEYATALEANGLRPLMKSVAKYINQAFDVAGLTRERPERVEAVAAANGGRIKK